ncbi:MAG: hypothetical protein AAF236_07405 [Verrucomicrobiota bacterium]
MNQLPQAHRVIFLAIVFQFTSQLSGEEPDGSGRADPGSFLGINCGKSGAHDEKQGIPQFFLRRNIATLNLAAELGLGWARCGGGPEQWYEGGKPTPQNFDLVVDHANSVGIEVYLFIEYRGDINQEAITDFDWESVGRAFATHFGNRVACYGMLNEVDHVASPHLPGEIATAVEAFSTGVKSIDASYLVASPSIGGTPMDMERADDFLRALTPLYRSGALDVLNLHSYHDSRPRKPHFSNIDTSSEWAPTRNFLRAKEVAGIIRPIRFAAGEFNYRNWDGSDADRASGFLTALWDQLMVVHSRESPERVGLFSIPYNIPDARANRETTMSERFDWEADGSFIWEPNEKGRVLRDSIKATEGAEFILCDPLEKGIAILQADDRKIWVWHNRPAFSSIAGKTTITISGIPADAEQLLLITHATSIEQPAETFSLGNQSEIELVTADLPGDQTLRFICHSTADAKTGSID